MDCRCHSEKDVMESYLQDPKKWIREQLFVLYSRAKSIREILKVLELIIWLDDCEEEQRTPCGFETAPKVTGSTTLRFSSTGLPPTL